MMDLHRSDIEVGEWTIGFESAGDGPPIVFLHGIGLSGRWWRPVLPRFATHHTVCAIDLPGFGRSSPIREKPRPDQYAALVDAVVQTLGRGPAVVVGHSLGGYVAVNAALEGARGMRAVALVAPAGFGPVRNHLLRALSVPHIGEALSHAGRPGALALLRSMVRRGDSISTEMRDWIEIGESAQQQFLTQLRIGLYLGQTRPEFIMAEPHPLPVPSWLGWGRHDSVFPIATADRAASVMGIAGVHVFEHSGHMPQVEEREEFERALATFIATLPG
jgi:pimeloyl-ACP methyl ester carboxylesterase